MISVVIPVFNVEKYLVRCLDSILNQTYNNFEVILVDDGSTDKSRIICQKYKEKDARVKFFLNSGKGPGAARNVGLEKARGEYIYFMDSDDEVLPTLLEENYNIAKRHNADLVCFSYLKILYKNGKPFKENIFQVDSSQLLKGNDIPNSFWELQSKELIFTLWNKLYKRDLISKSNVKFTNLRKGQDAVFNFQILEHVQKLYVNEKHYYKYHLYDSNSISSRHISNLFNNYKKFDFYLVELLTKWDIYNEKSKREINEIRFLNVNTCIANLVKPENNKLNFRKRIKECKIILNDSFTKDIISSTNVKDLKNNYRKICFYVLKTRNCYFNLLFQTMLKGIKKL